VLTALLIGTLYFQFFFKQPILFDSQFNINIRINAKIKTLLHQF